jgi:recombination protein RecR
MADSTASSTSKVNGQPQGLLMRLTRELVRLPGIGQKTAQRLAFHLMKTDTEEALRLAEAIREVKEKITFCTQCRNIAEGPLCAVCLDPKRDTTSILVVEEPSTLHAIEQSRAFRGLYHVLYGALSPLDGVGPADLRTHDLENRVQQGGIKEVIVATNPTIEGEATAIYLDGYRVCRRGDPPEIH